jgi:EF-P beta-lysylation protein EpmB
MITRSNGAQQPPRWQTLLSEAITDPQELWRELELPPHLLPAAARACGEFRLQIPRGFLRRMRKGDPSDPLLRQVLPIGEELTRVPGYRLDPLEELAATAAPGVLHKYSGRVLITTTGACAVHCRYCFRRHYPYERAKSSRQNARRILDYLLKNPDVNELILSGGDPLTLSNARLAELTSTLLNAPGLRRLRLHTRLPVVLPERLDAGLLEWLATVPLQVVVVIHCNHPNEIDASVQTGLRELRCAGATLLNQAVLLRGVNDSVQTLAALSERLMESSVLPYYLHQLDRVQGAAHFEVDDAHAVTLMRELRACLPGYLVPRLAREHPGERSKALL